MRLSCISPSSTWVLIADFSRFLQTKSCSEPEWQTIFIFASGLPSKARCFLHTVDICGWTKSVRTTLKPWKTSICWYLPWGIESFYGFSGDAKWISQPSTACGSRLVSLQSGPPALFSSLGSIRLIPHGSRDVALLPRIAPLLGCQQLRHPRSQHPKTNTNKRAKPRRCPRTEKNQAFGPPTMKKTLTRTKEPLVFGRLPFGSLFFKPNREPKTNTQTHTLKEHRCLALEASERAWMVLQKQNVITFLQVGMGQNSTNRNWTAGYSPCFHLPGQAMLGTDL